MINLNSVSFLPGDWSFSTFAFNKLQTDTRSTVANPKKWNKMVITFFFVFGHIDIKRILKAMPFLRIPTKVLGIHLCITFVNPEKFRIRLPFYSRFDSFHVKQSANITILQFLTWGISFVILQRDSDCQVIVLTYKIQFFVSVTY